MLSLEQITALDIISKWVEDQGAEVTWGKNWESLHVRPKWPSDYFLRIVYNNGLLGAVCQGKKAVIVIAKANIYEEVQFIDFKRRLFNCIVVKNANKQIDMCPCEHQKERCDDNTQSSS
jgi:hypothetical protein